MPQPQLLYPCSQVRFGCNGTESAFVYDILNEIYLTNEYMKRFNEKMNFLLTLPRFYHFVLIEQQIF